MPDFLPDVRDRLRLARMCAVESEDEDQWSWWQQQLSTATTADVPLTGTPTDPLPAALAIDGGDPLLGHDPDDQNDNDPVRMALIGLVAVLSVALAGVSYQRWGTGNSIVPVAAATTTVVSPVVSETTIAAPTTTITEPTVATTVRVTTTSTAQPTTTVSTASSVPSAPPGPPLDVQVVRTSSTEAEIRWRSEECVGSRYQVGDFEPGGGGFPDVNRCWFNHLILAGDPAFSPPLSPNTTYTVTIQAIAKDGTPSEPVQVEFTTSS